MSANKGTKYQNVQDTAKAVLREKFIVINTYVKEEERSQVNKLNFYLRKLDKKKQESPTQGEGKKG